MELETTLKETSNGLKSSRVVDRKKSAESLKDFLTRNTVPSLLTRNTLQKRGCTWNNLFDDINEFILKETEKFETSKTYNTNTRPLCASLLHSCVAGANRGKAYIKCDKITEACVYILSDNRLVKAIGDEYLSLLLKHVLPHRHYSSYITPNAWKELLDVCIAACLSEHFQLDNYAKLRIVYLVMKNGRDNCQFVKPLVASLVKVEKCFIKIAPDKKAQDVELEIIILLLEALSTEYRLTMCHFIENNLPFLLKYYDQNKDQKKKSSLFKLLNLALELHHPEGRLQNMESSVAYNWDLWNRYLKGITEIVYMEVSYLQKVKKQSEKSGQQCLYFLKLAAFIHYQMFESSPAEEEDGANTSKKLKLSFHNNKSFSDLLSELQQNYVPWLGILNAYVKSHGANISNGDFITLLNHLQVLLASDNNLHWEAFEELTCLVIVSLENSKTEEYENAAISLWNTCIRNCTTVNLSHKPVHTVIQCILKSKTLNYEHVQHLIKLYFEKDMPLTDSSVKSLSTLFHTFYNKYSSIIIRLDCVNWITQNDISNVNAAFATELILRIVASENLGTVNISTTEIDTANLHDILYNTIDKSILFGEFEEEIKPIPTVPVEISESLELINDINNRVLEYFKRALTDKILALRTDVSGLTEHMKLVYIVLIYSDAIMKYRFKTREEMMNLDTYGLLKKGLAVTFSSLIKVLKSKEQIPTKFAMLSIVQEMLTFEYDDFLSDVLRLSIDGDFFQCINHILNSENDMGDCDVVIEGDDREINMNTLKHNCIYMLAAYCRKNAEYREDIVKLILDPDLYNFSTDTGCVFRCIEILMDAKVEDPPYEQIFRIMQAICKDLYRDSNISLGIMKILVNLIDHIYCQDNAMKDNCFIMVKGYMQLCDDSYYSPKVVALIYECVAKIAVLNRKYTTYVDTTFENVLTKKLKGDIHSVRLYCSYLLKDIISEYTEDEIDAFFKDLLDIFVIEVDEEQETIIKDEAANRTFTLLHAFFAAALGKPSSIQNIVIQIINLQSVKSLDKKAVKKVLNKIVNIIKIRDLCAYLNDNILALLHFWFSKGYTVEKLPLYLFGIDSLDVFIKMHMKWLVAAEILWRKKGIINDSDVLQTITSQGLTTDSVLEACFSNIIILCLPYIVCDKTNLNHYGTENPEEFLKSKRYASRLYQSMGEKLENNKWSNLFVENVGDLLQLTAIHLWDSGDAERMFRTGRKLPSKCGNFYYPKPVFNAILDYFQELTDGNVIQYLCVNQTTTVFKILVELWKNVVQENVFEHKVLALYSFITFLKTVPLECPSDAFVCNFVCKSFSHVIKDCSNKDVLRIYVEGLKIALCYLLPTQISVMRRSVMELLPLLIIKKEEGFHKECSSVLNYLSNDMKHYLKDSEDVVDFFGSVSQDAGDSLCCTSATVFLEKLKSYKISLKCPSSEILANVRKFLVANERYVRILWDELESMRFSEDCNSSIVHQFVQSLGSILKSNYDDKTVIEACNCLAEIGTYDLKTLVTLPPSDTEEVSTSNPKQFFALTVVKSLLEVLFDKDPVLIGKVGDTLTNIMKSRQLAQSELGLDEIDTLVIKPFLPSNPISGDIQVDNMEFEYYCEKYPDGVFLTALTAMSEGNGDWLKIVTRTLLKMFRSTTNYFVDLRAVCSLKSQICKNILPALTGLLIQCLSERQTKVISRQLNTFFNHIWDLTFDDKVENSEDSRSSKTSDSLPYGQKTIVQYMLSIVDFLRVQRNNRARSGSAAKQLNFLDLEYNKVAWAAAIADHNWAAIYYGELWAVLQNSGVSPSSPDSTTNIDGGAKLQQILRKCYVSIGEIDAIEGCGTAHLTIEDEKRKHLVNTGQYSDALVLYDIALSCGTQVDHSLNLGVVRALHKSGMHNMALQYIKSQPENEELNDIKYECLSFLGDWSEFVDLREIEQRSKEINCHHNPIIKAFQYTCLKTCLNVEANREHENALLLPMNKAKIAVSRLSRNLNMDNCQNVYKILAKIHLFNDINDYLSVRTDKTQLSNLLRQWDLERMPKFQHFKHVEPLVSQRVVILEHAAKSNVHLLDEISSLQIQYAKMALSNNRVEMAQRLLAMAKKSQSSNDFILLESEISWAKGHKDIALSLLHKIVTSQALEPTLTAVSMRQYALWMAESKRDKPRDIINKYLLKSLRLLRTDHVEARLKLYQDIAKFADAEYKQVLAYMNSSVYENRVKCVENMRGTASSLNKKSQKKLTKEELRALSTNEKFRVLDEAEIANTKMEKENFLQLAMRYYLLSLKECDENNLSVFRVISLWLENQQFEFTSDGDAIRFDRLLQQIPSRKFITALPQLAPHLTDEDTAFITNLKMIIKRCAVDHPHHTLPILFGLKNSNKDNMILNASRSIGGSSSQLRNQEARTVAAYGLVQELASQNDELALIISQMEKLCDAIISFANYKVQTKQPKQKIPDAEMLHKLKNLTTVPIPTVVIPLRADCNYAYINILKGFEPHFQLVGGVNFPKKVNCLDTAGKNHVLLIKGQDDLRQDAVMQQVFNIVNTLLKKDVVTNRNKLLIRTYKVVPMSRQSGVLEWCEGTTPLGTYLVGPNNTGAHARYRPQDISCDAARKKMIECQDESHEDKLAVFNRIRREFKPVFHYFFTEHYLDPIVWYERRLAYTKSVATSSMVGYILGLGDRHVYNILIDQRTAEVIHIDLGIAFDQGKTLRTPETVPFRLTQDIVAGFGCSGVEGIFRRSCEKTMQLLRDNQETLLTILEVLLCDPLYSWSVKTAQQNDSNNRLNNDISMSDSHSGLAKRALLVVSSKLSGTEDGVAGGVAVPGQVARLLNAATDAFNLCRLFHGWQPYL